VRRSMAWAHPVADHSGSREEAEQKGRQASGAEGQAGEQSGQRSGRRERRGGQIRAGMAPVGWMASAQRCAYLPSGTPGYKMRIENNANRVSVG